MPNFMTQRSLYEVRERPPKTYSWKVFVLSNICVEIPWCSEQFYPDLSSRLILTVLLGAAYFFIWYYPIGLYRNAEPTNAVHLRGAQVFLFFEMFLLFSSTFAIAVVAGIPTAETAGNIANLMFTMTLVFRG